MATDAQRAHLHALMAWTIQHEPLIGYRQQRPMANTHLTEQQAASTFARKARLAFDCSEGVTLLCKWAGLADPNGNGYDGSGYTGTLLTHLPHYTQPAKAQTGALVVFGPGAGEHVCMVMEPGKDLVLWSHGAERGPVRVPLSVERGYHNAPVTFLSIARL